MNLDFLLTKQKHALWKIQLKAFLLDLQEFSVEEAIDHRRCELGKWLYNFGLKTYANIDAVHQLEQVHQQLHTIVKDIIQAKGLKNLKKTTSLFDELKMVSDRIESLLDEVETSILLRETEVSDKRLLVN